MLAHEDCTLICPVTIYTTIGETLNILAKFTRKIIAPYNVFYRVYILPLLIFIIYLFWIVLWTRVHVFDVQSQCSMDLVMELLRNGLSY